MQREDRIACHVIDIADAALDPRDAIAFVSDDAFGGIDVFIGRVRTRSQGRQCVGIHYDMFDPLALAVFRRAAEASIEAHDPQARCYIAHAKGKLAVGDLAVVVAFASAHRDAAFRGCRQAIEAVKHQAPIWKQEHFSDGGAAWSDGTLLVAADAATGREDA